MFDKNVYILDQSKILINNKIWAVDIIGLINNKTFNFSRISLTIALLSSNSQEKIENISCTFEKLYKENDCLNCFAENEMSGELISAISHLGKDIFIVNLLNTSNNKIDYVSNNFNRFYKKSRKGLSAGYIIVIILVLAFALIITGAYIMLILYKKKDKNNTKNNSYYNSEFYKM